MPCLWLAAATWRRRRGAVGLGWLVVVATAAGALGLIAAAESAAPGFDDKVLWQKLAFVPMVLLAPAWLLFAAGDTSTLPWLRGWRRAWLFLPGAITLALVATEPRHGLVWARLSLVGAPSPTGAAAGLNVERGPWLWIGHAGWSWCLALAATLLLAGRLTRVSDLHRSQAAVLAVAPTLPLVAGVLEATGLGVFGPHDPMPLALGFAALLVLWSRTTSHDPLDLTPLAYETVIQALDDDVVVLDRDNRVLALNAAAQRRLGQPAHEIVGRDAAVVYARWPEVVERWRHVESAREEVTFEGAYGPHDVETRILPLRSADGAPAGRAFITRDLRVQRAYERVLEQVANNDPLSGLPNRRAFQHFAEKALAFAQRHRHSVALLFIDLDGFGSLNDQWGHAIGNELLARIGTRLGEVVRKENLAARLGGDEFAVLLQGADERAACAAAGSLRERLEPAYEIGGVELKVGASIGAALFPRHGRTVRELLSCADVAMYEAKRTGSGLAFYDAALEQSADRGRICFAEEIEEALEHGQVRPFYQPIVATADGGVVAVEALARWSHPDRGVLLPSHFLPIAEGRRILRQIDRIVFETAAREIAPTGLDLSVNVSIGRLLDDKFAEDVLDCLARNRLVPSRLILEITETELATPDQAGPVLRRLRALGVRIATDDFGSGYSSLGYLRRLPLDLLKIEHSLIDGIGGRPDDEAIVAAILTVAKSLGLGIVAEGVEREEQRAWLTRHRCPWIQGFLIQRALPREELLEWLSTNPEARASLIGSAGGEVRARTSTA
ncbi:MAG TPA: EAL domain-containing protein [Thermoanaerobaculia bacterium]|nr:EAL domain-containing protein [Thermoanaerobaculia bacterium]